MKTDRGQQYSFKNFLDNQLNKNGIFPFIKQNKNSFYIEKVYSNKNFLTNKKSQYSTSETQNNNQILEEQKKAIFIQTQHYLDKKIIHLINCYKDLNFPEHKKTHFRKLSLNSIDTHHFMKKNNILSKSLTKTYKISEYPDKQGVKKLDEWDKYNLIQLYGNSDKIYSLLYKHYFRNNKMDKINELNYYKNVISSNGDETKTIASYKNVKNNKIIKDFLNLKIKEQTYILKNNIVKSHSKFNKTLLFIKEKKIADDLGLDNETFSAMRKPDDKRGYNYEKVIKDKDKKETIKKEELISILIKIFNKKMEKNEKEIKQRENFEKINQIFIKYRAKIIEIQFDIDSKKELYDKINDTEYEEEKMVEKLNMLQTLKYESEQEHNKQEKLRKELDEKIKELTKIKEKINSELEICKNEIIYLKLVYINLVKSQRNYYLDLLKKGYDVRKEGLIWVVKRLLEIQTKLEYHHFPKFLDNNHIKYIIEMSNLSLEEAQLKTILKIIEKKREDVQNSLNNKIMNKIVELSKLKNRHRKSVFTIEMEEIKNQLKMEDSDHKLFDTFEKIYRKYKTIFYGRIIQKEENVKIQKIIEELKSSLIEGGGKTTTDNFQQLTGILNYLNNNKESKEYLEILLLAKFRLSYIHKLRERLKEEQLNNYRQEVENNKNKFSNPELSLRLDLVKSALFGNKV